jgi:hypothetical protein
VLQVTFRRSLGPLDGVDLNCGMGYVNKYFTQRFVGIPVEAYRGGELCGLCLRMYCVDSVCEGALLRNETFMVLDSCQECRGNDIVASGPGMQLLSGVYRGATTNLR